MATSYVTYTHHQFGFVEVHLVETNLQTCAAISETKAESKNDHLKKGNSN